MSKVLFLGNGFNRCFESSSFSWKDLLDELKTDLLRDTIVDGDKPFSLLYEEIYLLNHKERNINEECMLDKVQSSVRKLQSNILFEKINDIGINDFVTTNYDYLIESSISKDGFEPNTTYGDKMESKYRIRTRRVYDNTEVWHVHGEIDYPKTIVLGHKMYSEVIRSISDYIYKGLDDDTKRSWIDYFFNDTVYMLGYGLSYADVTIWYVLNERARQIVSNMSKLNKVVFFIHSLDPRFSDLSSLLDAHYVEVIKSNYGESYEEFYQRALLMISNDKVS